MCNNYCFNKNLNLNNLDFFKQLNNKDKNTLNTLLHQIDQNKDFSINSQEISIFLNRTLENANEITPISKTLIEKICKHFNDEKNLKLLHQQAVSNYSNTMVTHTKADKQTKIRQQAELLADKFYQIADDNSGNSSFDKMQKLLDTEINDDNIIYFLDAYDRITTRKKDSSIIDTIISEKILFGSRDKQKKVLHTVMDKLCSAARKNGVSHSDIQKAKSDFEQSIKKEYDSLSGMTHFTDPQDMEKAIDFLRGAIVAKQNASSEEISDNEAINDFNRSFQQENDVAQEEYKKAREDEAWIANITDTVCGWFGCKTMEEMEEKLGKNAVAVKRLTTARTVSEFKKIYKEIFGIEFDKSKIAARNEALSKYQQASALTSTNKIIRSILSHINKLDYKQLKDMITKKLELDDTTIEQIIDNYKIITGNTDNNDNINKELLVRFLTDTEQETSKELLKLTNGKTIEQMEKDLDLLNKSAFGTNDLVKEVKEFNANMVVTEMVGEGAFEIAGTIALQFVPGLGQIAAARLAASAAKWGTSAIEIANAAKKAEKVFETAKKIQKGTKYKSKMSTKLGKGVAQASAAGSATMIVDLSNGSSIKEATKKAMMNICFSGTGSASSELAPQLMKFLGITNKVLATEIAEEIFNIAGAYGITKLSGNDYGSKEAFIDFATGIVMARLGHIKVNHKNNTSIYPDYSKAPNGTKLPPQKGVKLQGTEILNLNGYQINLNDSRIQNRLKALKEGESITIGREGDIRISSEYRSVSRQHIKITKEGDNLIITDISSYGTSITKNSTPQNVKHANNNVSQNKLNHKEPTLINGNETLDLAGYKIDLNDYRIQNKLKSLMDGESITIGREGDIRISNEYLQVSRKHLIITRKGNAFIITDISTNGTSIIKNSTPQNVKHANNNVSQNKLNHKEPTLINGNETLDLAGYKIDLNDYRIQNKLKSLMDGESITIGREGDIRIPNEYLQVSRKHLIITKKGNAFIITDISTNGTSIIQKLPDISDNELVRTPGNNGKPINAKYKKTSQEARAYLENSIANGSYTQSLDSYIETINEMHKISANGRSGNDGWYQEAGEGSIKINPGKIRSGEERPRNRRLDSAKEVEEIAKKYGDPYRVNESSHVKLKGIPEDYCPMDIEGGYHFYPSGNSLKPYYYKEMHRTAKEALELINNNASKNKILAKIAEHYQYAANARPYGQINNSLFMNEINTLLKKAGLKPLSHGILDIAAMHLQPKNFIKYFIDEYQKN